MYNKIVLIYDGIKNSVFEGQVLAPILKELSANTDLVIHLVSFESTTLEMITTLHVENAHERLKVYIRKKTPLFLGYISIQLAARQLKQILHLFNNSYTLQARGPLAGRIAQRSISPLCSQITLQARGLLAEEFLYTKKAFQSWYQKIFNAVRHKQLHYHEKQAYEWKPQKIRFTLESVSPALQTYLQKNYQLHADDLTIATHDIPAIIPTEKLREWRTIIRKQLNINDDITVFTYNGSCKPWQCFKESIEYFKEQLLQNPKSYLLVLSGDTKECAKIISEVQLPQANFHVTYITYNAIYLYLAACDHGILLRNSHVVNWISRPTKALEYQAAKLNVIHNNTIAFLQNQAQESYK